MRAILMIIADIIEKQSHKVPCTVKKLRLCVTKCLPGVVLLDEPIFVLVLPNLRSYPAS